ncbi:MAG: formate dehydrogenase accessory protein FdhE [Gordonibacter pamelaeae]
MEEPARAAARALEQAGCDAPHPLACPVCGGAPVAGRVGGESFTQGRGKTLWCAQCGTSWEVERVRCARCGTQNQAHLHYYNVEGDDAHRIATCDECGGYLRTVYADDALAPFSFEVEDVIMARLDAIAAERG